MSTRLKFIIGIIALFTVFLIAEYRMPRKFQWVPTFAHNDPQPFGCMVFDSVLAASMPLGYTVERSTLWQMEKDSVFKEPKAVLIITKEDIDAQVKKVLDLAGRGNVIMVATTDLYRWADTLGIDYSYHQSFKLNDIAGKLPSKGTLRLVGEASELCSPVVGEASELCGNGHSASSSDLKIYEQMIERTLTIPDSVPCEVLARFRFYDDNDISNVAKDEHNEWSNFWQPIAAAFPIDNGELILVSSPLLLSNYGMLSGDGHLFIAWLMNRLKHLPVIRTEGYMSGTAQVEQSPLYVFLQEPSLRWAVYLTMLTLLLFCIFTARRRQRVIPVVGDASKRCNNLEFARLIGTLYWQQHDNAGLLAKKLAYTAEELRRQTGIDITTIYDLPISDFRFNTSRDPEELRKLLKNIHQAATGDYAVSDQELKTYIDELDNLLHSL